MAREDAIKQCEDFIKNHSDWSVEVEWAKGVEFVLEDYKRLIKQEPTTKNGESCRYYGSHHEVCNYCYKCSLWTDGEPTTKNDSGVDCISRADAIQAMQDTAKKLTNEDTINGLCGAVAILYDLPSVTQEPRKGHWLGDSAGYKCNICGHDLLEIAHSIDYIDFAKPHYCPNCGADMREVEE